jgi:hypothetical protein
MYNAENYNMLDAIKANVMEFAYSEDSLEDANILERIFADVEGLRIRLNDLEKEVRDYRRRAIKAEIELRKLTDVKDGEA